MLCQLNALMLPKQLNVVALIILKKLNNKSVVYFFHIEYFLFKDFLKIFIKLINKIINEKLKNILETK